MRIIAGTKRGMRLFAPRTHISRPIIDRVKESLFDVLQKYDMPAGARVADLFCGIGSLGLESLSRGATWVTFVERNSDIARILNRNIEKAGFGRQSEVIQADVFTMSIPTGAVTGQYDLVFVDPPYADSTQVGAGSRLAALLDRLQDQVRIDGLVIVRTHQSISLLPQYGSLHAIERRQWGKSAVTFLRRRADDE